MTESRSAGASAPVPLNQNNYMQSYFLVSRNKYPSDLASLAWINQLDAQLPKYQTLDSIWFKLDSHSNVHGLAECHPARAVYNNKKYEYQI